MVQGGPDIARQFFEAGALDEIRLNIVPLILGAGTRLFDNTAPPNFTLRPTAAVNSPRVTNLTYVVEQAAP